MEYIQSELFLSLLYSFVFGIVAGIFQTILSFLILIFNRTRKKGFYRKPRLPKKIFNRKKQEELRIQSGKTGKVFIGIITFINDILFFIILGIALSIFYYYASDGEFRLFLLIGVGIGFCLYRFTLKIPVLAILSVLADILNYILDLIIYIVLSPFVLAFKILKWIYIKLKNIISNKVEISFHKKMLKELELLSCNGFLIKRKGFKNGSDYKKYF